MKNLFLRQNIWGNYAIFEGTKKVIDSGLKDSLIDWCAKKYPDKKIIDKT